MDFGLGDRWGSDCMGDSASSDRPDWGDDGDRDFAGGGLWNIYGKWRVVTDASSGDGDRDFGQYHRHRHQYAQENIGSSLN